MQHAESFEERHKAFLETARAYQRDGIVYCSPIKASKYIVESCKDDTCVVRRVDKGTSDPVTPATVRLCLERLTAAGGSADLGELIPGNRSVRATVLQAPWLAVMGDRKTVIDAADDDRLAKAFHECISGLQVDRATGDPKRYKPAMLATILRGIDKGRIKTNRIGFEAALRLFLEACKDSGIIAGSEQAMMAFYHLASEPMWLLSHQDPGRPIGTTKGMNVQQFVEAIPFGMLKQPYWRLMQDKVRRAAALRHIENTWGISAGTNRGPMMDLVMLKKAVDQTIRPWLIDKGNLNDRNEEGWHHNLVLPRTKTLLSREALQDNAIQDVTEAVKAAKWLLSSFEHTRAGEFLKQADEAELRQHVIDMIYGDDPVDERVRRMTDWASARNTAGKPIGFNHTIASYLLGAADPVSYAFCKPSIYAEAAENLLGKDNVEHDPARRIAHATAFYAEALRHLREDHGLPFEDLMHVHIAFYVVSKGPGGHPDWTRLRDGAVSPPPPRLGTEHPLNLILYGPPGTGKTYEAVRLAVEICDGVTPADAKTAANRLDQLREDGRVAMVTFHQSFGYEDFVEGIRPDLDEVGEEEDRGDTSGSGGQIRYRCRDGVFKRICGLAQSPGKPAKPTSIDLDRVTVWKMSLGNTQNTDHAPIYDYCIEHNCVLLGWGHAVDYSGCDTKADVRQKLEQVATDISTQDKDTTVRYVDCLKNRMAEDDLVVVSDGNHKFRAIGRIKGPYKYLDNEEQVQYHHMRPVEWLLVSDDSMPVEKIYRKVFSQSTLYRLNKRKTLKTEAFKRLLAPGSDAAVEPHVLIIDEINRANVSKVLGELITLLEPDKRLGGSSELRVELPYSGQTFGVPGNLYVLGTMNTADRSIALIDTALRRRFEFREVMPDTKVIENLVGEKGVVQEVSVGDLLETLNQRIEMLYDRDHQLGHSYLLGVKTLDGLRRVFLTAVIPLLQEYFYNDWVKIAVVLGCPFDPETGQLLVRNDSPILSTTVLDRDHLPGQLGDSVNAVRCGVNPRFGSATEDELPDYFSGIVSAEG